MSNGSDDPQPAENVATPHTDVPEGASSARSRSTQQLALSCISAIGAWAREFAGRLGNLGLIGWLASPVYLFARMNIEEDFRYDEAANWADWLSALLRGLVLTSTLGMGSSLVGLAIAGILWFCGIKPFRKQDSQPTLTTMAITCSIFLAVLPIPLIIVWLTQY